MKPRRMHYIFLTKTDKAIYRLSQYCLFQYPENQP